MTDALNDEQTSGRAMAIWVFEADLSVYDPAVDFETDGYIDRWSAPRSARSDLIEAGQGCLLLARGEGVEPALVGFGGVLSSVYDDPTEPARRKLTDTSDPHNRFVDVEIFPLYEPIPLAELAKHPDLAISELFHPGDERPLALSDDEWEALGDNFDLDVELIAPPDLAVEAADGSTIVFNRDDEGVWVTDIVAVAGDPISSTSDSLVAAIDAVAAELDEIGHTAAARPVAEDEDGVLLEPLASFGCFDGFVVIVAPVGDTFAVLQTGHANGPGQEPDEPEVLGTADSLVDALRSVATDIDEGFADMDEAHDEDAADDADEAEA